MVYSEGYGRRGGDRPKIETARFLMSALAREGIRPVLAVQALAELHHVLLRKAGLDRPQVRLRLASWCNMHIAAVDDSIFDAALELATTHAIQIYDAIILAVAARARCNLLLSEDLQDGFTWRGVIVTNPFGTAPDSRIARWLT